MKLYAVRVTDEWLGVDANVFGLQLVQSVKYERVTFRDRGVAVTMVRAARQRYGEDCSLVRLKRKK